MPDWLSPKDRQKLFRLLSGLPQVQFNELLYALGIPPGIIPPSSSAQGERVMSLLQWVEAPTGCKLPTFLDALDAIAPETFQVQQSASQRPGLSSQAPPASTISGISSEDSPPDLTESFSVDLGGGVTLEMVYISGGRFWMGSPESEPEREHNESPQHRVNVNAFYIGKYPVTQQQWRAVSLLDNVNKPLLPTPSRFMGEDLPVTQVSWYDAVEFCTRLSNLAGQQYRLPSEAEWEYACRAGTATPFAFGEAIRCEQANYDGNHTPDNGKEGIPTPVGLFPANAYGLHDMHGSVMEWCQDFYHDNYQGAPTDGSAWLQDDTQTHRVLRGGAWNHPPKFCRSAHRFYNYPGYRNDAFGFRIAYSAKD